MKIVKSIRLVVLLGNPGKMYEGNRHNAGRLLAGSLRPAPQWRNKFRGLYAAVNLADFDRREEGLGGGLREKVYFLMPETYMNLSGESVLAAAGFYGIPCDQILVVHDELELPLGAAAFKEGGGLGGHNGLRSIRNCLGSADFWRLRIGIGRPGGKKNQNDDISGWVLSDFTPDEAAALRQVLDACAAALIRALSDGPASLLPEWSRKRLFTDGAA
ncbi:MAG: aminoacyl-tRNA hydrolase [Spirochaetaceae bacterium]|nr:aminoacyl-tRNA hydrolase [Spirochaetaceae bacterium]